MRYVQPADRTQFVLMNTLDDLVPPSHPVRIIDAVVEQIVAANPDEFACERDESDPGRPAFAPQTMLKLFLYGYLIKGERVAIDGTKMRANAKREMLTIEKIEKRLQRLDEQLEEYPNKLAENDIRDDLAEELDSLDGSIAVDQHLVNKIIALQRQVEELQAQKATLEQSGKSYLSPKRVLPVMWSLLKKTNRLLLSHFTTTLLPTAIPAPPAGFLYSTRRTSARGRAWSMFIAEPDALTVTSVCSVPHPSMDASCIATTIKNGGTGSVNA